MREIYDLLKLPIYTVKPVYDENDELINYKLYTEQVEEIVISQFDLIIKTKGRFDEYRIYLDNYNIKDLNRTFFIEKKYAEDRLGAMAGLPPEKQAAAEVDNGF